VTGESDVPISPAAQGIQLSPGTPGALCSCGCGGRATKASGYLWAYVHDPGVPEADRLAGRQLGGRRGSMTPAEVVRLLDGAPIETQEGRQQLRDRFLRLRLAGRIGTGVYQDLMRALDGAAKDQDRTPKPKTAQPIEVIVQRYGNGAAG
jgi:hypothetical protein